MKSFQSFKESLDKIRLDSEDLNSISLEKLMEIIPSIAVLEEIPKGSTILARVDLDMPIKNGQVVDLSRINSSIQTIKYCVSRGWKLVIFGHLGRDKDSVVPVCNAMSKTLGQEIELVEDWLIEDETALNNDFINLVENSLPGSVFMLENTRKYSIERALWKCPDENILSVENKMYQLCYDIRKRLTQIEINEAIAASNFDFSSSVVPLLMTHTALGFFISDEFKSHVIDARKVNLVVFSGLKIDKLDDLEGIIDRGNLDIIIAAGSLAMALKKANCQLKGSNFDIGRAERNSEDKAFISIKRIEQSKRIIEKCQRASVDLVLPLDFILDSGDISETIPLDRSQFDIGPKSITLFKSKIKDYIQMSKTSTTQYSMFYNGVFGKFEDERFENGTKSFIELLKIMTDAGIKTYVGGGEGRLALLKYGSLKDVTHAFTCGGTILKSLTNRNLAFLKAMYLQNTQTLV